MPRKLVFLFAFAALWALASDVALAQQPEFKPTMSIGQFPRGSGGYLAWWKMLLPLPIFWVWVKSLDWQNQDGQRLRLASYRVYNVVSFLSFLVVMLVMWFVPVRPAIYIFLPVLALAYVVPFVVYVKARNREVMADEKVFTRKHMRRWFSETLRPIGIRIDPESHADEGPPVELIAKGAADERQDNVNLLTAKQSPFFEATQNLMLGMFERRASSLLLDFTQQAVAVQHLIDGVWYKAEPIDRATGDAMLAVLKQICALNPQDRRTRQRGLFGLKYHDAKITSRVASQGTQTGERVLVQFVDENIKKRRLPDLGMRDKMQADLAAILGQKSGMCICSAPSGGGLTSLITSSCLAMDRYLRSFVCIEDSQKAELEIENVPVKRFDSAKGETASAVLIEALREYPDAIVVPDLFDPAAAVALVEQARVERFVVAGIRAKEASEALVRVVSDFKVPADRAGAAIEVVLNVRLVRRLCEACREPYTPNPADLARMRIPADRVQVLYRARTPTAEQKEICPQCQGLGYAGRTGIYEMLTVTDEVRDALVKSTDVARVRDAARKAGMRVLQEEGLRHVVAGTTSVEELIRVLKE